MTQPLVSILIPCHNAAPFLEATLASATSQTWPRCEIILVDDGSTDDSLILARAWESRGVQVLAQPNRGAAAARNRAFAASRGDYIQFLDADDLLAPDKIARQLEHATANPPNTAFTGRWGRFHQSPDQSVFRDDNPLFADLGPVEFFKLFGSHDCMMHPAAWLLPRALANAAGPWDERLSLNDDGEYFARVVAASARLKYCPEAVSFYRSGLPGSLSSQRRRRHLESAFLALRLTTERMLALEDSPEMRRAAADLCQRFAYDYYPAGPDLVAAALARVRELGGSRLAPQGGRSFHLMRRLLGWRAARRLQVAFGKFPAPSPDSR